MFDSLEDLSGKLAATGYFIDPVMIQVVFLAAKLQKPLLLEGPVGSGKTQLALSVAAACRWTPIPDILQDIERRSNMSNTAQKQAIKNYRSRLRSRGVARFEVLGLDSDRDLIRSIAKRLTQNGPEASRIRLEVTRTVSDPPGKKGGILAALRRSPLVGADLEMERPFDPGRKVVL